MLTAGRTTSEWQQVTSQEARATVEPEPDTAAQAEGWQMGKCKRQWTKSSEAGGGLKKKMASTLSGIHMHDK